MREMKYMVPNKRKRLLACSMTLLMLIGLSGCTTLAENESTAEYMQSGKVTDSGYKTTQVYEGSFDIPYEADAAQNALHGSHLPYSYTIFSRKHKTKTFTAIKP